ncbi:MULTISPECIES: hypothetical protein [unclassified Streptomyces]|uniref:hypothetical protein n=1 Tax=unclassified Streptomyces TaxID=2593676 RepID=UPI002E2A403A|nr:hypothetical protein [Streptomyces sp. NBC_00273]
MLPAVVLAGQGPQVRRGRRSIEGLTFAGSFLTEHDYTHHLRRCLTDSTLPRQVRITGALVVLHALPLSRISELTTTQFRRTPEGAFLTLGRHPVLVPPRLALLIEEQM